jgi:hypothetical protein
MSPPGQRKAPEGSTGASHQEETNEASATASSKPKGTDGTAAELADELPGALIEALARLEDVHLNPSGGWYARCPVCKEGGDKFTIVEGNSQPVVVNCYRAGCQLEDGSEKHPVALVEKALGLPPTTLSNDGHRASPEAAAKVVSGDFGGVGARRPRRVEPVPNVGKVQGWCGALQNLPKRLAYLTKQRGLSAATIATYDIGWDRDRSRYTLPVSDAAGEVVDLRRYTAHAPKGTPKMKGLTGGTCQLYPWPDLITDDPDDWLVLCEGEWDALITRQHGIPAVTGTAGATLPPGLLPAFAGRRVAVIYDSDAQDQATKTAALLREVATDVRVVDLGLGGKGDLTDWFMGQRTADELRELIEGEDDLDHQVAVALALEEDTDRRRHHLAEALTQDDIAKLAPPEWLVDNYLPAVGVAVVWGEPGIGKTLLLIAAAKSVIRGSKLFNRKAQRGAVLFYEGEGLSEFRPRLNAYDAEWRLGPGATEAPAVYWPESVDLNTPRQVAAVIRTARMLERQSGEPVRMVVLDPLIESMSGDEIAEGMDQASRALRVIARELNCCVLVGHHSNAGGERPRGNDKLRARVHSMFKMERITNGVSGLVCEKQRSGEKFAMELEMVPSGEAVVFDMRWEGYAQDYASAREHQQQAAKDRKAAAKADSARQIVLDVIADLDAPTQNQLLDEAVARAKGDPGRPALKTAVDTLVEEGLVVRIDVGNRGKEHRLAGDQVSS